MNWKLISLVTIGLVLVFVSWSARSQTCFRTSNQKTSQSRCTRRWFRKRCSTTYGRLTVKTCCTGYCGSNCEDRNECSEGNPCRSPQLCENTPGSYKCVNTCRTGFKVSGFTCVDANECTDGTHGCSPDIGICKNTHGSYTCTCKNGYRLLPDRKTCLNEDEFNHRPFS